MRPILIKLLNAFAIMLLLTLPGCSVIDRIFEVGISVCILFMIMVFTIILFLSIDLKWPKRKSSL